jgi:hypothetical protein
VAVDQPTKGGGEGVQTGGTADSVIPAGGIFSGAADSGVVCSLLSSTETPSSAAESLHRLRALSMAA